MDSASDGRHLKNNDMRGIKLLNNNNNSTSALTGEEMPKILSPEALDVLPVFANMLDFKSFTRLALASKEMYKRCMEDKRIKISVNERSLEVISYQHQTKIGLQLKEEPSKHREKYLAKLRQPPCVFTLESVCFCGSLSAIKDSSVIAARDELRAMSAKSVKKVEINDGSFVAWKQLETFIKEFHVKSLKIRVSVPDEAFFSLLRLELDSFISHRSVPINVLLRATSPILSLELTYMDNISGDDFMQILWLIQTGSLLHLTINEDAVSIDVDESLPYTFDGPIPDERPLLFHKKKNWKDEFCFLHWHGGVTKVLSGRDILGDGTLTFSKCDRKDYPLILRKDEEMFEDLKEEMAHALCYRDNHHSRMEMLLSRLDEDQQRVSCSFSVFLKFSSTFPMLGAAHDGPLPTERPLYFNVSEESFWMLNKDDVAMKWEWKNGFATWKPFDYFTDGHNDSFPHSVKKLLVRKMLQKNIEDFRLPGVEKKAFASWFEGFRTLPMEFNGPLPEDRPLVFESGENVRIFVDKDGFVYRCVLSLNGTVHFNECSSSKLPTILFTKKNAKDILQLKDVFDTQALVHGGLVVRMDLETFLGSFDEFKTIPFDHHGLLPDERPLLIIKKTVSTEGELIENRLVLYDNIWINSEWKDGQATFSEADLREYPRFVTESLFFKFLKGNRSFGFSLFMEFETIEKYLALFKTLPYDYMGPLPEEDIVIFVEKEVKDGCRSKEEASDSAEMMMTFWILSEGQYLYCSTWGEKEALKFESQYDHMDKIVPPALKTKEHLKQLLLKGEFEPYDSKPSMKPQIEWNGDLDEFLACISEFTRLPYRYDGELPEERPLVFEVTENEEWLVFREDGRAITCEYHAPDISFPSSLCWPPPAIRHLCH